MSTWIINKLKPFIVHEKSSQKLATSFSLGAYVAFSPFIGCHTLMVIILCWVFKLHWPTMLASSNLINNPWTMVPVYSAGYFLGDFILHDICGINGLLLNPSWMSWVNEPLGHYLGMPAISLWSF